MHELIKLSSNLLKKEGMNSTLLPSVNLYLGHRTTERGPLLYNQGVIFMLQGEKHIFTDFGDFCYDPKNFVVLTVPMPLECQAVSVENRPIIGLTMDIESTTLNSLINTMEQGYTLSQVHRGDKDHGLYISKLCSDLRNALHRLLICLQDPLKAKVLGPDIIKEIHFIMLLKEESAPLYALATKNTGLSKIEFALKEVQKNYAQSFDVESLAKSVNMSVSSFHHSFKKVTSSSPIQYIKKIRLTKARDYLINENQSVNEAAIKVGYESVSQFNREFKRYYGMTPGALKKTQLASL